MSLPWFRMYTEFATDPDVQCLAFEDQRHYVVLLCLKGCGVLDKDYPDASRRYLVIRKTLGLDAMAADETKRRLYAAGLIDEMWQPLAWDKRQYESDVSTTRVRKYRNKQKKSDAGVKRRRNVSETAASVSVSTSSFSYPPDLDLEVWERWLSYRKQIRKPIKPVSVPAAQRKLAGFGEQQGAVVEQSIANGWTGLFALKDGNGASRTNGKPGRFEQSTDALRRWADG